MKRILLFVLIAALLAFNVSAAVTGNSPSLSVIQGYDKDSAVLVLTNDDVNRSANCIFEMENFKLTGQTDVAFTLNETSPFVIPNASKINIEIMIDPVLETQGAGTYQAAYEYNCSYNATDFSEGNGQATLSVVARSESITLDPSSSLTFSGSINTSRTLSFDIRNNGNVNLTNVEVKSTIATRYSPVFTSNTEDVLTPGETMGVSLKITIPQDQQSGLVNIGTLNVTSDEEFFTKTNYFKLNAAGLLTISDLDVDVENPGESSRSSNNLEDGDEITRDVAPGATVEFNVEITNNHDDDFEIQDPEVLIIIVGIDGEDGDDLEEDATFSDVRDGRNEDVTLSFDIPFEVEEDTYDVEIHVEGEDEETGDLLEIDWVITLEVKKDRNKLKLTKANLDSDTLKCFRSTTLNVEALNIGERDEDDARLVVFSEELGISFSRNFELQNDVFDDESYQSFSIPIDLTDTFEAGTYRIDVVLYRDVDEEEESIQLSLRVEDCESSEPSTPTPTEPTTPVDDDPIEVVVTDKPIQNTGGAVAAPVTAVTSTENDGLYVALLVVGILVCVLLIVWLVMQLFRK